MNNQYVMEELDEIVRVTKNNIIITDGTPTILRASPSCYEMYGVEAHHLIGKNIDTLEEEGVFYPSVTKQVLKEKKQVKLIQKTFNSRVLLAEAYPIFNEANEVIRIVSFAYDLTEIENLKKDYENLSLKMSIYEDELKELKSHQSGNTQLVTQSRVMDRIIATGEKVAQSNVPILLLGESGVGKTMIANYLHQVSEQQDGHFVAVNCSAIPSTLFESEFFGYVKGAFTGADQQGKIGYIERANGGTLFLDEVAELPLEMQAKLLTVIQEKKIKRLGDTKEQLVQFRIIAATNKNLAQLVTTGEFREDLYYRLNVIPMTIPPLRERKEDLYLLIHQFLTDANERYKKKKKLHPTTLEYLIQHEWRGNVRELMNFVERLTLTIEDDEILPSHLLGLLDLSKEKKERIDFIQPTHLFTDLQTVLEETERYWLDYACNHCSTTYEMARFLGVSQPTVVRKLKKYQLTKIQK